MRLSRCIENVDQVGPADIRIVRKLCQLLLEQIDVAVETDDDGDIR
jgi:hypothetical protein